MTDKYELSRRKVLAGLGTIGVAGAGAGIGTSALFTDDETIEQNSITAGELDMAVTASIEAANDYWAQQANLEEFSTTADGDPVTGLQIEDIKPGDWGIVCFNIEVVDNPACLRLVVPSDSTSNDENTVTEPEADADAENNAQSEEVIEGDGELADAIQVSIYDGFAPGDQEDDALDSRTDLPAEADWTGSLSDVFNTFGGENGASIGQASVAEGSESPPQKSLCALIELPSEVGNEVQTDSVGWDLVFNAVQRRNRDGGCEPPVWAQQAQ